MTDHANDHSRPRDTVLDVQGMSCPSCVHHITAALAELVGVHRVAVDLRGGLVVVTHDATQASSAHLIESMRQAGYASRVR